MTDLIIGVVVAVTAIRVFLPDALRLARRSLAAGVRVGVASLGEHPRLQHPPRPAPTPALHLHVGEEEHL